MGLLTALECTFGFAWNLSVESSYFSRPPSTRRQSAWLDDEAPPGDLLDYLYRQGGQICAAEIIYTRLGGVALLRARS